MATFTTVSLILGILGLASVVKATSAAADTPPPVDNGSMWTGTVSVVQNITNVDKDLGQNDSRGQEEVSTSYTYQLDGPMEGYSAVYHAKLLQASMETSGAYDNPANNCHYDFSWTATSFKPFESVGYAVGVSFDSSVSLTNADGVLTEFPGTSLLLMDHGIVGTGTLVTNRSPSPVCGESDSQVTETDSAYGFYGAQPLPADGEHFASSWTTGIKEDDINASSSNVETMTWDLHRAADQDYDGVPDATDNCPTVSNADQADLDKDGIGDACDTATDSDNDGVIDKLDNCPTVANPDQADLDTDGIGDACDPDIDGDKQPNTTDPCPTDKANGCVNHPPVAVNDSASAAAYAWGGTPTTINVLANDSDPDGDPIAIGAVTQPTCGVVTKSGVPGAGETLVYTAPAAGCPPPSTTFTYTVTDGKATSAPATVTVNVQFIPDGPVANPDTFETVTWTGTKTFKVLRNDTGNGLHITSVGSSVPNGSVVSDGQSISIHFPRLRSGAKPFLGNLDLSYSVADVHGQTASTTVHVHVFDCADTSMRFRDEDGDGANLKWAHHWCFDGTTVFDDTVGDEPDTGTGFINGVFNLLQIFNDDWVKPIGSWPVGDHAWELRLMDRPITTTDDTLPRTDFCVRVPIPSTTPKAFLKSLGTSVLIPLAQHVLGPTEARYLRHNVPELINDLLDNVDRLVSSGVLCFTDIQLKALVLPSGASGSFAQQFFATGSEHPHFDLTLHLQSGLEGYTKTSGWKILNGRVSAAWACSVYAQSCKTVVQRA